MVDLLPLYIGAFIATNAYMKRFLTIFAITIAALVPHTTEAATFPEVLDFHVESHLDSSKSGFTAICTVESLITRVPIKIDLMASKGVEIVEQPKRLKGRLAPGKVARFKVRCQVTPSTPKPFGLNFRLRYRLPMKALRDRSDKSGQSQLDEIAESGKTIRTMYRSALFNE